MKKVNKNNNLSRRDFLSFTTGVAATVLATKSIPAFAKKKKQPRNNSKKNAQPNILFIFTDQERYFSQLPQAFSLPGHELLADWGTQFTSHYISSCMCTSSRSVMLTGLQTIDNGMFENVDMPYVKNLSFQTPTIGHMLRKAGYYTAYKGKWHLNRDFEHPPAGVSLNTEMEKYGFSDFYSPGDSLAHAHGGFKFDNMIGSGAVTWLRNKGRELSDEGKPWSLTVSLINPHDIMYFNADAPDENVQDTGRLLMTAKRAPNHAIYRNDWSYPLSSSLKQSTTEPGRPAAHDEYHKAWGYCLGHIPLKDENWNRFTNYYLNSIRFVDTQIFNILQELEGLGLADNTVVVFTADHGEMGGSHGLRGKGPFAYRESLNVPMYIVHPDFEGGKTCDALSSHIDIVPTLLSIAGVNDIAEKAGRDLPGKDISSVLSSPENATKNSIRDAALFTYSGISTNDAEVIRIIAEAKANGKNPKDAMKESGYKPNLKKRGTLRSVYDGRYKFTRYFAPVDRHSPKTLTELFANNDVELFDLLNDPEEMINLAVDTKANEALILAMNNKLEAAIAKEMGKDDGREMPDFPGIDWSLDRMDL